MSLFADPALGLRPGPLHDRLAAQSRMQAWYGWAGTLAPRVLDSVEFEYFAIRNQATLFDISPMKTYRLRGPGAEAMLNRMVTRNVARIAPGRVGYALWCDEAGHVIDDGTLFRLGADDWRLCCQERMLTWLLDAAFGFDAEVEDESDAVAGIALQGPTAFAVLEAAGWGDLERLKPFDHAEAEAGIRVSRTGFTGDLGYELWCAAAEAGALWDRLWEAGAHLGLRAIGNEALNIARLEAGFLTAGIDFQPVHATERLHRGRTPEELGLGRHVDFGKGHFNGRRALMTATPRSLLLRVEVEGFKPATDALVYSGRREVGHVTSAAWSPSAKRSIALAEVRMPYAARVPARLAADVYVQQEGLWSRRMARLTPQKGPFYAPARARATPPGRY